MCDAADDESCTVWSETTPRARKAHQCTECRMPIAVGVRHTRISSMFDGHWEEYRLHTDCHALVKHIAFDVCGQSVYFLAYDTLRARVREHMHEEPGVLRMWRDILRARRAEGVWPVRRAA